MNSKPRKVNVELPPRRIVTGRQNVLSTASPATYPILMALPELLSRIDQLKAEIDTLRPLKPEVEKRIMDKFRLDWNFHSNAIEGNRLTLGETRAFLLEGLTADGKPLKDHLDIRGHNEVVLYLIGLVNQKERLDEVLIRELRKILLHEPYLVEARTPDGGITKKTVKLGAYKTEPNLVQTRTGETRHFTLPEDTPAKMYELLQWLAQTTGKEHPVLIASIFHHRFTQIHPFDDGNGRMARLLMNLILMQSGYPPVVIKIQERDKYIAALEKADVGEVAQISIFVAENLVASEELYLKGAKGDDISELDDVDKRIALLKQELKNVAEPIEFTHAVQVVLFREKLKPSLITLIEKLELLDEFFSNRESHLQASFAQSDNPQVKSVWYPSIRMFAKETLNELEAKINEVCRLSTIEIKVSWKEFKKAGLNHFDYEFRLTFDLAKFVYQVRAFGSSGELFRYEGNYSDPWNEDQKAKIARAIAEGCLNWIEKHRHQKQ